MSTEVEGPEVTSPGVAETLRTITEQLAVLTARVAALEAAAGAPGGASATAGVSAPVTAAGPNGAAQANGKAAEPAGPGSAGLDEETLAVISAAIAAFLGKKPRIRQIRLLSSSTWAQQGRVGIHASHAFARSGAAS